MFNFLGRSSQPSSTSSGLWFTFFTQGNTVYKEVSEDVQATITKDAFNSNITIKFGKQFPSSKSNTKVCTRPISEKMYQCKDCMITDNSCFCEECFDSSRHQNHAYSVVNGSGYCDCGIDTRWKKEGFCDSHGSYAQVKWILSESTRIQYIQFFKGCFRVLFQLINNSLNNQLQFRNQAAVSTTVSYADKLFEQIAHLTDRSSQYQQLTYQILMSSILYKKEEKTILQLLFELNNRSLVKGSKRFMKIMLSHRNFMLKCYEFIFTKFKRRQDLIQSQFTTIFLTYGRNYIDILNELADRDIIIYGNMIELSEIFSFYCAELKKLRKLYEERDSILLPVWKCLHRKSMLSLQTINPSLLDMILVDLKEDKELTMEMLKLIIKMISISQVPVNNIIQLFSIIIKVMYPLYDGRQEEIVDGFKQLEVDWKCLQIISKKFLRNYILKIESYPSEIGIRILLKLIKKYSEDDLFFKDFWMSIAEQCSDDLVFIQFTSKFIKEVIAKELKNSWSLYTHQRSGKQNTILRMQKEFKQFLYMSKEVKKSQLISMKNKKFLSFPNAGKILNKLTEYNEPQEVFIYNSSQVYYRPQVYLLGIKKRIIPEITFVQGQDTMFQELDEGKRTIFQTIFPDGFEAFIDKPQAFKSDILHNVQYVRILNAVVLDKLLKGENQLIREYLLTMKKQQTQNQASTDLDQLFGIKRQPDIEEAELPKEESEPESQMKQKKKKKKQLLQKNYQKKRKHMFSMYEQEIQQKSINQDRTCLICKESDCTRRKMYYLGKVSKSVIQNSFFKGSMNANIIMDTCFHPIHDECFMEYIEQSSNCPLCDKQVNCVFPFLDIDDEDYYRFWKNRIIYLFVRDNINVDKMVMMLLKSLILRNGISLIFNPIVNDFKIKKSQYFFQLFRDCRRMMSDMKFHSLVEKFTKSIAKTQNIHLRLIEGMFADAYISLVENRPFHSQKQVNQLQSILDSIQFQYLRKSLQQLIQRPLELGQVDKQKERKTLFKLKVPSNAFSVTQLRQECSSCESLRGWFCVNCQITFCYECDMISHHKNQYHREFMLLLILWNGKYRVIKRNQSEEFHGYCNYFMENWNGESAPAEYFLNKQRYYREVSNLLVEF